MDCSWEQSTVSLRNCLPLFLQSKVTGRIWRRLVCGPGAWLLSECLSQWRSCKWIIPVTVGYYNRQTKLYPTCSKLKVKTKNTCWKTVMVHVHMNSPTFRQNNLPTWHMTTNLTSYDFFDFFSFEVVQTIYEKLQDATGKKMLVLFSLSFIVASLIVSLNTFTFWWYFVQICYDKRF